MSIVVKGMKMPQDCPHCPLANWANVLTFLGCNAKPGKRYAMRDEKYRKLSTRPGWCPLTETEKGEWVKQSPLVDTEECSVCGYNIISEELETPFCPWCGSEMRGTE